MSNDAPSASSTPLSSLRLGEWAHVRAVGGDPALRVELLELGLVPGTQVQLMRVAPLGDPLQVRVGRARLALRRAAADLVEVSTEATS